MKKGPYNKEELSYTTSCNNTAMWIFFFHGIELWREQFTGLLKDARPQACVCFGEALLIGAQQQIFFDDMAFNIVPANHDGNE